MADIDDDWMIQRRRVARDTERSHTETRTELPDDAVKLIIEMAEQVRTLNVRMTDHARRLALLEGVIAALAAEVSKQVA